MILALVLLAVALLAALAYWELVIAEGVHLGPRVVAFLYDLVAPRYDRIKQFNSPDEAWFLSDPLVRALRDVPVPLVLDVATGTGRLPLTLLAQPSFRGRVIALDSSRVMLAQAARDTRNMADRLTLIWQDASHLPFNDEAFDAVTCLEALEFMPSTQRALSEITRVLRPGGVMLLTNRIGPWAKFLPGHTTSPQMFETMLGLLGLERIQTQVWQMEYDRVWARKPGSGSGSSAKLLPQILRCPRCNGSVMRGDNSFTCSKCGRVYRIAPDGVIEMMRSDRRPTTADHSSTKANGRKQDVL
jgi:ubiquinone/menaquinone biosynthesis C-methylase UbiE